MFLKALNALALSASVALVIFREALMKLEIMELASLSSSFLEFSLLIQVKALASRTENSRVFWMATTMTEMTTTP